ncbi:DUF1929 domain-containing protein, partial [Flavobacteriaceae bacterium TP-CH-4]
MGNNYSYFIALLTFLVFSIFNGNAQDPSQVGSWGNVIPFDIVPVAVANLPDGRIITWSSKYHDDFGGGDGFTFTQIFDPSLGTEGTVLPRTATQTNHDMFCPGINNLADGRILAAGGSSSERVSLYDPNTGIWTRADDMIVPRGYQGNVTLATGAVFTLGGSWSGGIGGKHAEIYSSETGWIALPSIQGELLMDGNDNILDEPDPSQRFYRGDNHAWLWAAPNGKVFHAGPGTDMHWLDVSDINNPTVQNLGARTGDVYSMKGTSVMYDIGKLLKVGGSRTYSSGTPASDKTFIIDINNETPLVTEVSGFQRARTMHNSVVLPDGKVLVTGGLSTAEVFSDLGARFVGEIFDPVTNSWSDTAPMQIPRTYHSVSILLPDGRVFVGGGGLCGDSPGCDNHLDAEIYSPPYLFGPGGGLAARPTIQAPDNVDYNSTMPVTGSPGITEFSFIRLSSATHSTNNEQRRIPLSFTSNQGTYNVEVPNRELLPPGYYMLFALDTNGVPSVAEHVKVGSAISIGNSPNLVLNLKFDEGSGIDVADSSNFGNDATMVERDNDKNPIPVTQSYWTADGLFGSAMEMDGKEFESNSIVEVPYSASMASIKDEMTVMAWVYRDEIEKNVAILAHDYPKLFFGFHNSLYKLEFPTSTGSSVNCYVGYSPASKWVHVAATFNGQVGRLFANGIEICTDSATGEITLETSQQYQSSFTTSGFYDDRQPQSLSGITDELDGRIDELRVYNKALSASEITSFYEIGKQQGNPEVVVCPPNTITAEYRIGSGGTWQSGNIVNAEEGQEVYIRANVPSGEEYFVTLPFRDQNRFSSVVDFPNFEDTSAYKIDTFINGGNGLIAQNNTGLYALTTSSGCIATIDLRLSGGCQNEVIQEYRINGVWQSGLSEITVEEGDDVMLSILPNGLGVTITLPNGSQVGDNYSLGSVTTADAGVYALTSDEGCTKYLTINVRSSVSCVDVIPIYTVNGVEGSGEQEITVNEGDGINLAISIPGIDFSVSDPDGNTLPGSAATGFEIENITTTQEGVYTLTTPLPPLITTINFADSSNPRHDPELAIDGSDATFWHTKWENGIDQLPHEIQFDLGTSVLVEGLTYLPRQDGVLNGTIASYEIYVSENDTDWGSAVSSGTWGANSSLKTVSFTPKQGRYVRLRALSEVNGNPWTSAAEVEIVVSDSSLNCTDLLTINVTAPPQGSLLQVSGTGRTVSSFAPSDQDFGSGEVQDSGST